MPVSRDYDTDTRRPMRRGCSVAACVTLALIVENVALLYWLASVIWAAAVDRPDDIIPILFYGIHLAAPVVVASLLDSRESATASTRKALTLFLVLNGILIGDVGSLVAWVFASTSPLHNFVLALLIYAIVMDVVYYIFVIAISGDMSRRRAAAEKRRGGRNENL
jgi:hypothetical protein